MKERKSLRMMLLGLVRTPGRPFESWRMEEEEQAQEEEGEDKFSFQHVDLKALPGTSKWRCSIYKGWYLGERSE